MRSSSIQLMVVSSQKLFRQCVAALLESVEDFSVGVERLVVGEVLEAVRDKRPDVLLIDFDSTRQNGEPNEMDLVQEMLDRHSEVKLLLMGVDELDPDILKCIEAGAQGYVSRESSLDDLKCSVRMVMGGGAVCPPRLAYSMFSRLGELSRVCERDARAEALQLTPRELEILQLIALGYSNKKIAEALFISIYTVKNHIHHILEKLQVSGRAEAVSHAISRRWLRRPTLRQTQSSALHAPIALRAQA